MSDKFDLAYQSHRAWIESNGKVGARFVLSPSHKPNFVTDDGRFVYVEALVNVGVVKGSDLNGKIVSGLDLEGVDFSGYEFRDLNLSGVSFRGAVLSGSTFAGCNIEKAIFDDADLSLLVIKSSTFSDCSFRFSVLNGAKFNDSTLTRVVMENSKIDYAHMSALLINDSKFQQISMSGTTLTTVSIIDSEFLKSALPIKAWNIEFQNCSFFSHDFSRATLDKFSFVNSDGVGISWVQTILSNGKFSSCRISAADMAGSKISATTFSDCDLGYSYWVDWVKYNVAADGTKKKSPTPIDISQLDFVNTNLTGIHVQLGVVKEILRSKDALQFKTTFILTQGEKEFSTYKVFICHAVEDKLFAREIFDFLCKETDVTPWLDKESILPGRTWEQAIPKAIKSSDAFIALLSHNSTNKRGVVQKEIRIALDTFAEIPDEQVFIFPVKLDECKVPEQLKQFQSIDYTGIDCMKRILVSIRTKPPLKRKYIP